MKTWEKYTLGGLVAAAVLGGGGLYYEKYVKVLAAPTLNLQPGNMGTIRLAKSGGVLTLVAPSGATVSAADSGSSQTSGSVSSTSTAAGASASSAVFQSNGVAGRGTVTITWSNAAGVAYSTTLTVVTA